MNYSGCGDNGCVIRKPSGMATNGGCRCPIVGEYSPQIPVDEKLKLRSAFREYKEELQVMKERDKALRKLLWLRHGCDFSALYDDDGEMRCSKCHINFRRASIEEISNAFTKKVSTFSIHVDANGSPVEEGFNDSSAI